MSDFTNLIQAASAKYGVRADLIAAVVQKESGGNPFAIGDGGAALGLMQVHRGAAQDVGMSWDELHQAIMAKDEQKAASLGIEIGAAYLAKMLKLAHGDESLALMAYNQGPGVISKAKAYADAVEKPATRAPMTTSHIVATGGITSALSGVLVYLTHWPWQPMTIDEAGYFATLIVAVAGGSVAVCKWCRKSPSPLAGRGNDA